MYIESIPTKLFTDNQKGLTMEIIKSIKNDLHCSGIIEVETNTNRYDLRLHPTYNKQYEICVHLHSRKHIGSFREFIQLDNCNCISDGHTEIEKIVSSIPLFNRKVVKLFHESKR